MDVVETAQRLADDVLFPAALETDRADVVPIESLDALAAAGLYGLASPAAFGGYEADFETVCADWEDLSRGCLTTALVCDTIGVSGLSLTELYTTRRRAH